MKPTPKISLDLFNSYVDRKLITRQEHPSGQLYIWNYTPIAQFSRTWDDVTMQARGLITDLEGNIVARPFRKFFNIEEYPDKVPKEQFQVAEKLDGSLGIMYPMSGGYLIATRGSFTSDQAMRGSSLLAQYLAKHGFSWIDPEYTYLFEVIYPANRIVVDYGDVERLALLAVIHTKTGDELDIREVAYPDKAKLFDTPASLEKMRDVPIDNAEGYVVRFQSGLRIKMKFAEYVRLHRLLTQVSSKSIWELLRNGQEFDELLDNVPDEFYDWVKKTADDLRAKHTDLITAAHVAYEAVRDLPTRKEMAAVLNDALPPVRAATFALLDGKDSLASDIAWKAIKPAYEKPFKQDIDA